MFDQVDCESDIKNHKIKQAMVFKQSRYLKEWRQRWIVLTENRLYSFEKKQVYKNPTQILYLDEVQTLKIYHKGQQERKLTIRVESKQLNFYMSFNNTQDKWSWVSAIERMIAKRQGHIQEDKKIADVVSRSTFISRESVRTTGPTDTRQPSSTLPDLSSVLGLNPAQADFAKKKKVNLGMHKLDPIKLLAKIEVIKQEKPDNKPLSQPTEEKKKEVVPEPVITVQVVPITSSPIQKKPSESDSSNMSVSEIRRQYEAKQNQESPSFKTNQPPQIVQKIVQKIVEKIVEKPVYIEKPSQVIEKIVEKIVYVDKKVDSNTSSEHVDKPAVINKLFDDILESDEDYRKFIISIVDLATIEKLGYGDAILQSCLFHKHNRFFSEAFLQIFNRETEDQTLNIFLKFIVLMYEKTEQYFYLTDLKVLIDILIREIELYRSELSHFLILMALKSICTKTSFIKLQGYRTDDLKNLIEEVQKTSPSAENQRAAHELLTYI